MPLNDKAIRNAKPRAKEFKMKDEGGLFLLVTPTGRKGWRFRFRLKGKEGMVSLGAYPAVGLKDARTKRDAARQMVSAGINPSKGKPVVNTFEDVARAWHKKNESTLVPGTNAKHLRYLEVDVFPIIGHRPIADLAAPDLLAVIKRFQARGVLDVARRMHNVCGRVMRYAVAHGLAVRDCSRDIELKDVLPPMNTRHHASVTTPVAVGELLRAIDGFTGAYTTQHALRLAPLVFVRPGELRRAEWAEIDFGKAEWRIPASKMKMKEQHIVPLSTQSINILHGIHEITGDGKYVFPGERTRARPMSENTINAALRRMGYTKDEMTGHGFRSMASTLLHEMGLPHAVIERQLAHGERNKVSAAYNFAEYLPERRRMMQQWADYLDKLKTGADIIPLHGKTG